MKNLFFLLCLVGCSGNDQNNTSDAGIYTYPEFTSVCQLDSGMGVQCSNFTPNKWAWSWYGVGENGLESYYCNQAKCISGKQCMVQNEGKLLNGTCQ